MRRIVLVLAVAACATVSLFAQLRYRPTENGPWRPWSFTAIASARQARGATPAEVQAYQAKLQELAAIVKRAPAVATPVGFAAELWGNLDGYGPPERREPQGKGIPLAGSLSFGAFPLVEFTRNGRLMNEDMKGGETQLLQFTVNRIDRSVFSASFPIEWSGEEAPGFFEPQAGDPVLGLPRIGDVLVLRKNNVPMWMPLTLEEALQPVIGMRKKIFENRRDVFAKEAADFAEWQTPAKRAARRADWQVAAKSLPNGAEFLASMEQTDGEIEKANRERLAPGGPEERGVKEAERDLREAEAVVSGLSPGERSGPSCYVGEADGIARRFRPLAGAGSAACRPLVRTNWSYFDPKLPRSAAQVLMIDNYGRCLTPESAKSDVRGGCAINRLLLASLDWDAVRNWLDR